MYLLLKILETLMKSKIIVGALLIASAATSHANSKLPLTEQAAINTIYHALNGPNWTDKKGWVMSAQTDLCEATGITCWCPDDTICNVRSLNLSGLSEAQGELADLIAPLTLMTELTYFASMNPLGSIPSNIGDLAVLTKLTTFRPTQSRLVGEVPDGITNLTSITSLNLYGNALWTENPATQAWMEARMTMTEDRPDFHDYQVSDISGEITVTVDCNAEQTVIHWDRAKTDPIPLGTPVFEIGALGLPWETIPDSTVNYGLSYVGQEIDADTVRDIYPLNRSGVTSDGTFATIAEDIDTCGTAPVPPQSGGGGSIGIWLLAGIGLIAARHLWQRFKK
jgi:hypothetical protein